MGTKFLAKGVNVITWKEILGSVSSSIGRARGHTEVVNDVIEQA